MAFCGSISSLALIVSPDGNVTCWSPAAATEFGWSEMELRGLGIQGLFSTAGESPHALSPGGSGSQQVKVLLKGERAAAGERPAVYESQIVPMVDPGGCVCGHLHLLRPSESEGKVTANSVTSPAIKAGSTWSQVLHQLNNVFAGIHSSLDLVLSGSPPAEAESFLVQAQECARRGALIVNELQLRGKELQGLAEAKGSDAKVDSTGSAQPVADPPPADLEGSERLLLADDDNAVRTLIRAVLAYRGYEIIEAVDGEDALDKYLSNGPFDLVILDRDMPKFSGAEVLQRIRAHDPSARVLSLSGSVLRDEAGQDPASPFNGLLSKPFHNMDLLKLVRRILDQTPVA